MGKPEDAIKEYRAAAAVEPGSIPLALRLAELFQTRGQSDAARRELDRVAERLAAPRNLGRRRWCWRARVAATDLLLALAYMNRGDATKAEPLLRKLLEKPDLLTIQAAIDFYLAQGAAGRSGTSGGAAGPCADRRRHSGTCPEQLSGAYRELRRSHPAFSRRFDPARNDRSGMARAVSHAVFRRRDRRVCRHGSQRRPCRAR